MVTLRWPLFWVPYVMALCCAATVLVVFEHIAWPGEELHTAIAGDLDPARPGHELLVFTHLGNVYDVGSPGKRLYIWMLRIPLPFALLAVIAQLNGWTAGAIASAIVVAVTFIETLSHLPRVQHEAFSDVRMREAAATWPIATAALVCAAIWAFGFEPLHFTRRAVRIEGCAKAKNCVPTGDIAADMVEIQSFYAGFSGKNPGKFDG